MNKKLKIIIIFFIFIILGGVIFIKSFNTPEKVIKNHIKYKNTHNIKKLSSTITDEISDNYIEYVDNIETIKLINMELQVDSNFYNIYINGGKGRLRKDLSRDDIKIYTVNYYIKYKDDNKSVKGSGKHSTNYILIKEKSSNKWIIDDMGG
ncbi:DUF4829 domain-containing protein [Clostridium sartagoforme]|uniref:DUF4829 domain-containing protein n=1 Tax=Clostridium sartagoforme TaxID=84031 RepID=A0A4S2DJK4_9CLOT|nr:MULTISPECIES: DUF4829 domain-containing protein [Clostridium]MBS5938603.1 DUF4829 domain-containing protein [Clostridium sp.]TGY41822.1 DUF4829 domain-containing protein [Clostridium sartagoforme]